MNIAKLKMKIKTHKEQILTTSIFVGVVAVYVGLIAYAVKKAEEANAEAEEGYKTVTEAALRGDLILPNRDGSFWILPRQQV